MAKQFAEAADRNRHDILGVLRSLLPETGDVLEVASGSGQHAVHFARHLPGLSWQPTDVREEALASIAAWRDEAGLSNLLPPVRLDVTDPVWPVDAADVVVCINMIHASPWECGLGMLAGAGRTLGPGGVLFLYGPYRISGEFTTPSNEAFDGSLRGRDPSWGIRDIETVDGVAAEHGLVREAMIDTPINNFSVLFRRR